LVAALVLANPSFAAPEKIGKGEGALEILTWPGYIERGETDKNYDWVTEFEKKTGCKVNVKTANTSDEMVAQMNEASFDLVTASGDASLRLIAGGRVQEINTKLILSYNNIDPRLQKASWHFVNNKNFGVPYQWGHNVLAYNTNVFKTPPKSWEVVFKEMQLPDGKSNRVAYRLSRSNLHCGRCPLLMYNTPDLGIRT
jgi:putative spermidine/putrescine transport system substrate-binding protein